MPQAQRLSVESTKAKSVTGLHSFHTLLSAAGKSPCKKFENVSKSVEATAKGIEASSEAVNPVCERTVLVKGLGLIW